jgi:hypothetical protein
MFWHPQDSARIMRMLEHHHRTNSSFAERLGSANPPMRALGQYRAYAGFGKLFFAFCESLTFVMDRTQIGSREPP